MSLFQCGHCGCCENTALTGVGTEHCAEWYNWEGIEEREGKKLCSACAPTKYEDGTKTQYGKWHGEFPRVFLPKGKFKTNRVGNLEHIESGSEDYRQYAVRQEEA